MMNTGTVYTAEEARVVESIRPVLEKMDFGLVELKVQRRSGVTNVTLVLFQAGGVTLQDCADVSKILGPRLEIVLDTQDIYLEVMSPGIDRVLKHSSEFTVFIGKGIRVYDLQINDWRKGILRSFDGSGITLETKEESGLHIELHDIQKAKLDFTVEEK